LIFIYFLITLQLSHTGNPEGYNCVRKLFGRNGASSDRFLVLALVALAAAVRHAGHLLHYDPVGAVELVKTHRENS
jgi:hypothetical protein